MPYIKKDARQALAQVRDPVTPGELNYALTLLCDEYLQRKGVNYQHISEVVSSLEGAKLEFYRRVAAPYEDTKIAENGDVYTSA